jgi:hypothetical protein
MNAEVLDRLALRDLVQNWLLWRDAGDWERFATVWHEEGWMAATWFQGNYKDFIRVTIEGWNRGVSILHFLGGSSIELEGDRAIVQTKMTISQRGPVNGVLCDVVCTGRFFDFCEKRDGRWAIVLRQPIYEKDRVDPVDPAATRGVFTAVAAAIKDGLVVACHDCSDGGLAAALAEMAIGGGLGARIDLARVPAEIRATPGRARDFAVAFGETPGRFLCEVPPETADRFERALAGTAWAWIGDVTAGGSLEIVGGEGTARAAVADLDRAWRGGRAAGGGAPQGGS